jgi:putative addiction module antidote
MDEAAQKGHGHPSSHQRPLQTLLVALMCYSDGMTKEVTLRQAGGSVSATLPKDMADRLRLEAGDRVLAVETDRGILLTPYDPDTERALRVAAKAAKKYRNALRELAK